MKNVIIIVIFEGGKSAVDKEERKLRKEKESLMMRSWLEKTRIQCAIKDDSRRKRKQDSIPPPADLVRTKSLENMSGVDARAVVRTQSTASTSSSQTHLDILEGLANLGRADSTPTPTARAQLSTKSVSFSEAAASSSATAISSVPAPGKDSAETVQTAMVSFNETKTSVYYF